MLRHAEGLMLSRLARHAQRVSKTVHAILHIHRNDNFLVPRGFWIFRASALCCAPNSPNPLLFYLQSFPMPG